MSDPVAPRRNLLITLLVIALLCGGLYWAATEYIAPVYVRSALIDSVKWGNDGSLYIRVAWNVAAYDKKLIRFVDNWRPVWSASEPVIYRINPDEKIVRRLSLDEGRKINERWDESYWIGARYGFGDDVKIDTYLAYRPRGKGYWNTVRGRTAIHGDSEQFIGETRTVIGHHLIDFQTRETTPLEYAAAAISPDDRFVIYLGSSTHRVVVRWLPEGREVSIPDSVIPQQQANPYDHTEVYPELRWLPVYATTSGLLDPARQMLIDPVTFQAKAAWYIDTVRGGSLGPNGASHVVTVQQDATLGITYFPEGIQPTGWDQSAGFGSTWAFPRETRHWHYPEWWTDLEQYPSEYAVQFAQIRRPS